MVEMVVVEAGCGRRGRLGDALNDLCATRQLEQSKLMSDEGVQIKKTSTDMQ